MKNWINKNLSMVLAVAWFIFIMIIAALFSGCSVDNSKYVETHIKYPVDSVIEVQPVSTLEFEPKYKVYYNHGEHITTKNYRWASTKDSIEIVYVKRVN